MLFAMDRLEIRLRPRADDHSGRWVGVQLFINGENLQDLVTAFETRRGYEPAGGYDAIAVDGLRPAIDRLTGKGSDWPGDGQTVLLVCAADGEEGCWPIFARVVLGDHVVEWRDFNQPHRPGRDYSGLHFAFSRTEYDQEIRRVLSA